MNMPTIAVEDLSVERFPMVLELLKSGPMLVLENNEPVAVLISIEQWNSMNEQLSPADAQAKA